MLYGYRPVEVGLALPNAPKADVLWILPKQRGPSPRTRSVAVSLGAHIEGAALPHPCGSDPWSTVLGTVKRSASRHPVSDDATLARFFKFVETWLSQNLQPLPAESDTSFHHWLEHTNYPLWKKDDLLKQYDALDNGFDDPLFTVNKCFVKNESYPEYKYPRGIYSRSDTAKMHIGPFVKLIEEEVYKNPFFIKHIPVDDRPNYIMANVQNINCPFYLATDYTAFESQFVKKLMVGTEIAMLKYMTKWLPDKEKFWWLLDNVISGVNHCVFKGFRMFLEATRMSGEMTTSLSNGFSNLMFMLFTSEECGLKNVRGVVEGDDGLFSYDLPPGAHIPTAKDFARLGLTIKIEEHEKLSTASFCGMIFDEEERVPLTDPIKAVAMLGWMDSRFTNARRNKLQGLLRCKAMSMKSQYPGCPILDACASWILRCTKSYDVRSFLKNNTFGLYQTDRMRLNIAGRTRFDRDETAGLRTRSLMAEKFGISPARQADIEKWFDAQTRICPIPVWVFGDVIPNVWKEYYERFSWSNGTSPLPDLTPVEKYQDVEDLLQGHATNRKITAPVPPPNIKVLFNHHHKRNHRGRAVTHGPPPTGGAV